MKSFKKLKILAVCLISALCIPLFSGCTLISTLLLRKPDTTPTLSDYVSETEISADSLMAAREEIRSFNIAIDTQYQQNFGWVSRTLGNGLGSGVVFEEDENYYYALTNDHVITDILDGKRYTVSYTFTDIYGNVYTGSRTDGTLVLNDEDDDIAIVRLKKSYRQPQLGKANYTARLQTNLTPDEFVLAVGNPSGVNNIVTYGKTVKWEKIGNVDYSVINHTALINPGNSGGALCDIDGNLLGLNTWGSEDKDDDNFAIPLSKINEYINLFHEKYSLAQNAA